MNITSDAIFINKILSSGISYQDAVSLCFENCSVEDTASLHSSFEARQAIKMPFFNIDGTPICEYKDEQFYRIRYLYTPQEEKEAIEKGVKLASYRQAKGTSNHLYIPLVTNGFSWQEIAHDIEKPLFFTEGELKASKGCIEGYPTLSICGVWNFQDLKRGKFLVDEFNQFTLRGRTVYVCYDSDVMVKDEVLQALFRLTEELEAHGAIPYVITFPDIIGYKKVGLDDFMVHHEKDCQLYFDELVENSVYCGVTKELFKLNEQYCYVQHPGAIVFKPTGTLLQKEKFKDALLNCRMLKKHIDKHRKIKFREVNAANEWLKWPARESANLLCYEPGKEKIIEESDHASNTIIKKFNTWHGWGCDPEPGDVGDFLRFFDCICSKLTEDEKKWFMSWIAWPIQNPGCKLFTAAVLYSSQQGNGKTLLGEIIGKLYGKNYYLLNKSRLKNSNFNEWSIDKSFILADEITGARSRDSIDTLKLMITQSELSINRKNFSLYTVRDTINYIFTTNHGDAFHLEDNDRRFFVVNVPKIMTPEELGDIAFKYNNNGSKAKHLFHYLLNYEISDNFSPYKPAPTTKAKDDMRELGRSELGSFVRALRDNPESISQNIGEIISTEDALLYLRQSDMVTDSSRRTITKQGISREFSAAGIEKLHDGRQFRVGGQRKRFFILRNSSKWNKSTVDDVTNYLSIQLANSNPDKSVKYY